MKANRIGARRGRASCIIILLLVGLQACGGGSSAPPRQADPDAVAADIDASGGTLVHGAGLSVDFAPDSLDGTTRIGIAETGAPAPMPSNLLPTGTAFSVTGLENRSLGAPATLVFQPTSTDLPDGALGIYRWNGERWQFLGGSRDPADGSLRSETRSFSVFTLGTGASLHKTVTFSNGDLLHSYVVSPYEYILTHPDLDAPIGSLSVAVFDRAGYTARMSLAQGRYSFCVDWDSGEVDALGQILYRHSLLGSVPDAPLVTLTEETPATVPPHFLVGAGNPVFAGRCPAPRMLNASPDAGTGINLGDPEVTLTWNNDNDMDLWVSTSNGAIAVGWAEPGPAADTARLDVDERCAEFMPEVGEETFGLRTSISNGGPEHIFWQGQSNLLAGTTYQVWVNFFSQCQGTLAGPTSLPRIRLVVGANVDFFPGTDVGTDMVMSVQNPLCLLYEFQRGVWPPRKCGRDFQPCCNLPLPPTP